MLLHMLLKGEKNMKKARRFFSWLLLIAMLLPMLPTTALTVFANESTQKEDAMETIKADKTLNTDISFS